MLGDNQYALGEIRMFAGTFAPVDWAFCQGQLLSIEKNQALHSIIGVVFGGDNKTNFALPDLRGRFPIGEGQGEGLSPFAIGSKGGVENVGMTVNNMPPHMHGNGKGSFSGTSYIGRNIGYGDEPLPTNNFPAMQDGENVFATTHDGEMAGTVHVHVNDYAFLASETGIGQPFNTMSPFIVVNYIICVNGYYPTRN